MREGSQQRQALHNFCFPHGTQPRSLSSEEYYYNNSSVRDENWFIFTINSNQDSTPKASHDWDIPNKDQDVYYCI